MAKYNIWLKSNKAWLEDLSLKEREKSAHIKQNIKKGIR